MRIAQLDCRPKSLLLASCWLMAAAAGAFSATLDGPWVEEQRLAPAGEEPDGLGWSVSLDGDVAIGGAWFAEIDGNPEQGTAYIFRKVDGVWVEEQKLTASDGTAFDRFGRSVALEGDTAVVGAYVADVGGNSGQGAVYVFERIGGVWDEQQKLTASDGAEFDRLGDPVALEGVTLMAAASGADIDGTPNQGAVYVFERDQAGIWGESQKLTIADGTSSDLLGLDGLTIRGETVLIGARSARVEGENNRGAAYFFERSAGVWQEGQRLTASDGEAADGFGSAVDFKGDIAVVGAHQADPGGVSNKGAAYVFARRDGVWFEKQILVAPDGNEFSNFGKAVAVEDGRMLVSGESDEPGMPAIGAVYSYRLDAAGWVFDQKLLASDSAAIDSFGRSLDVQGDVLLAGASTSLPSGAMYVFRDRLLFADGFESGNTSAWSATVP